DEDARDLCFDQPRRARGSLFVGVTARLQRHIHRCALGGFAATVQRLWLGVRAAKLGVITFADDAVGFDDDAADHRIWLDAAAAVHRQTNRAAEKAFIGLIHAATVRPHLSG